MFYKPNLKYYLNHFLELKSLFWTIILMDDWDLPMDDYLDLYKME